MSSHKQSVELDKFPEDDERRRLGLLASNASVGDDGAGGRWGVVGLELVRPACGAEKDREAERQRADVIFYSQFDASSTTAVQHLPPQP